MKYKISSKVFRRGLPWSRETISRIEALNESRVATKQTRDAVDHARSIDAAENEGIMDGSDRKIIGGAEISYLA